MKMDWKSEASASYEVYPEGGYILRVQSWEKTDAQTGTPQLRFHFSILKPEDHAGKTYIDHFALTEKALWRLATFVARCGVDIANLSAMEVGSTAFKKVLDATKNRKVGAIVIKESYNGKERNKVAEYQLVEKVMLDPTSELEPDEDLPDFLKQAGASEDSDTIV